MLEDEEEEEEEEEGLGIEAGVGGGVGEDSVERERGCDGERAKCLFNQSGIAKGGEIVLVRLI